MNSRNLHLITVGTIAFLAGTVMLYFTSFDPDSAWAGYALASHLGGLAITSIGINDETKQSRKQQVQRHHPAGTKLNQQGATSEPAEQNRSNHHPNFR